MKKKGFVCKACFPGSWASTQHSTKEEAIKFHKDSSVDPVTGAPRPMSKARREAMQKAGVKIR